MLTVNCWEWNGSNGCHKMEIVKLTHDCRVFVISTFCLCVCVCVSHLFMSSGQHWLQLTYWAFYWMLFTFNFNASTGLENVLNIKNMFNWFEKPCREQRSTKTYLPHYKTAYKRMPLQHFNENKHRFNNSRTNKMGNCRICIILALFLWKCVCVWFRLLHLLCEEMKYTKMQSDSRIKVYLIAVLSVAFSSLARTTEMLQEWRVKHAWKHIQIENQHEKNQRKR